MSVKKPMLIWFDKGSMTTAQTKIIQHYHSLLQTRKVSKPCPLPSKRYLIDRLWRHLSHSTHNIRDIRQS